MTFAFFLASYAVASPWQEGLLDLKHCTSMGEGGGAALGSLHQRRGAGLGTLCAVGCRTRQGRRDALHRVHIHRFTGWRTGWVGVLGAVWRCGPADKLPFVPWQKRGQGSQVLHGQRLAIVCFCQPARGAGLYVEDDLTQAGGQLAFKDCHAHQGGGSSACTGGPGLLCLAPIISVSSEGFVVLLAVPMCRITKRLAARRAKDCMRERLPPTAQYASRGAAQTQARGGCWEGERCRSLVVPRRRRRHRQKPPAGPRRALSVSRLQGDPPLDIQAQFHLRARWHWRLPPCLRWHFG